MDRGADLHVARLMPLQLTVCCFSKMQICFVPVSPRKGAVKCVCRLHCVLLQMNDGPFVECCEMIANWLSLYRQQPTRTPRLRLSWSVSRRTLHKMRPSTRAAQDLEPIIEDESLRTSFSNNDNDSSAFDRYALILNTVYNRC